MYNFSLLLRNDSADGEMDNLYYEYNTGTDKLNRVTESVTAGKFSHDIDHQAPSNYGYDAIGNLISDRSEDITEIRWTPAGKVERIIRENPTKERSNLFFSYGPLGNRLKKTVHFVADNKDHVRTTYYTRDASGNTMATYVERNCALQEFQDEEGDYYY